MIKKYLKLLRVKHYLKNLLLFLPILFSGQLLDTNLLVLTALGFCVFSLLSSVVYIINDIRDREKDRNHPTKCNRPLACGSISVRAAIILACFVFVVATVLNYFAVARKLWGWIIPSVYVLLNFGYSLGLKNTPILDVAILVSGYFLRVLFGSVLTSIVISNWLYLTVLSASFYLGLGKRRNELDRQGADTQTRGVLKYYNYNFLDKFMYLCLTLAILFYSLWTVDSSVVQRIGSNSLVWTIPIVILMAMRYSLNVEKESDGDPIEMVLKDIPLIVLTFSLVAVLAALIYL